LSDHSGKRLIEVDFPLEAVSLDSVHEKNVRHGHISTLHIWPARRPLAASRAALIATLLPDPGSKEKRDELKLRLAGRVGDAVKKKDGEESIVRETEGGILHWGRESGPDLQWFRDEIRKAYGGRAPRVLDPFAGGGAIPLEAMRLGCEVTAADINPVAWFILKCTLDYPQRLAGQTRRLPDFALADREFMADYLKAKGMKPAAIRAALRPAGAAVAQGENHSLFDEAARVGAGGTAHGAVNVDPALLDADLAWHVRAWGRWVLAEARKQLADYYPTYAEYCTLKPYAVVPLARADEDKLKLVPPNAAGEAHADVLNTGYDAAYLADESKPRWVVKPTVAYLWARTVRCKSCRAELPLLKTAWLNTKAGKRARLTYKPNAERTGVVFAIEREVRKGDDKALGAGTMGRSGAKCPCCDVINTMEDIRIEGRAGRMGQTMTAVVVDSPGGKEYRMPTVLEIERANAAEVALADMFAEIPFGLPTEPTPKGGNGASRAFSVDGYGFSQWHKLYTSRQLLGLGAFITATRRLSLELASHDFSPTESLAMTSLLATVIDRLADRGSTLCSWTVGWDKIRNTFVRWALPISWDFAETTLIADASGGYPGGVEWLALYLEHAFAFAHAGGSPTVIRNSATQSAPGEYDVVVTDPPYYDAIPYSDLMDFFYIWLRRTLHGLSPELDATFSQTLSPKWNHEANDGELIDDAARFEGDAKASKRNYEEGMARAFQSCHAALKPEGRLVIVFAHKHPDAWETLVAAIIRAGFVVDGSWPIQTERAARTRSIGAAALSSSIWLVCKKRPATARAGWDEAVILEMQQTIPERLRAFWDAGIRGPDFVWAATGPALESYSRHPVVKKVASADNEPMDVGEFLRQVRRIVVEFAIGRILHAEGDAGGMALDDVTTYYLLHRKDFGLEGAAAGACILYATSCGVQLGPLADQIELLVRSKGKAAAPEAEGAENAEDGEEETEVADAGSGKGGSEFRLKPWHQRKHRGLGEEASNGRPPALIDQLHRMMQLWRAGDVAEVNAYLDRRSLRSNPAFPRLIQALIEMSRAQKQGDECAILESLSNHVGGLGLPGMTPKML
jgi:adenine-specific DNA methylase